MENINTNVNATDNNVTNNTTTKGENEMTNNNAANVKATATIKRKGMNMKENTKPVSATSIEGIESRKQNAIKKQVRIGYTVRTTFSTLESAESTLKQFQSYGNGLMLGICYTLHKVDSDKLYKGQYKSTADFASAVLGYDKSAVSRYIKVGSHVIPTQNGYIWDKTIPQIWNVTKASEALPLLKESANGIQEAISRGDITENSTAKEIRAVARGTKSARENSKTFSQLLNSKELNMSDIEMLSVQIYKGLLKLQSIGIECMPEIVQQYKNGLHIIDENEENDENDENDLE